MVDLISWYSSRAGKMIRWSQIWILSSWLRNLSDHLHREVVIGITSYRCMQCDLFFVAQDLCEISICRVVNWHNWFFILSVHRRPAFVLCRAILEDRDRETICNHQLEIETLANLSSLTVSSPVIFFIKNISIDHVFLFSFCWPKRRYLGCCCCCACIVVHWVCSVINLMVYIT